MNRFHCKLVCLFEPVKETENYEKSSLFGGMVPRRMQVRHVLVKRVTVRRIAINDVI
jgi:hypothetical protein